MGIALAATGAGLGVAGGVFRGFGDRAQLGDAAQVSSIEAMMSHHAALDAFRRGEQESSRMQNEANQLVATQQVIAGASGVDLSSSTVQNAATVTRSFAAMDAETIRANAAREAWGLSMQADAQRLRARSLRKQADWAPWGHILGGIGQGAMAIGAGIKGVDK